MAIVIFGILFIGLLLRINYLYQHDIWFDEAFSFFVATKPLDQIIQATAADNHPPLYEILLHFWIYVFGGSEIGIRSFSLVTGLASIPIFYFLTKKLFDKKITFYSTSLFILSPLMIYFSSEARMYSLFVFLSMLTVFFFLKLNEKLTISIQILFVIFFTLSLYTHYYTSLLLIPFLYILHQQKIKYKLNIYLLFTICYLLFTPWLWLYSQSNHPPILATSSVLALPATFVSFILGGTGIVTLRTYFGGMISFFIKIFFSASIVICLILFFKGLQQSFKIKNEKNNLLFLIIPLIFLTIINFLIPVFSVRSTIFLAPFFYILLAFAFDTFQKRFRTIIFGVITLLMIITNLIVLTNSVLKGPSIQKALKETNNKNLLVHTSILTYYPFLYYQPDTKNILVTSNPLTLQTVSIIGGGKEPFLNTVLQFTLIEISQGTDEEELTQIKKALDKNYTITNKNHVGNITLSFYKKPLASL